VFIHLSGNEQQGGYWQGPLSSAASGKREQGHGNAKGAEAPPQALEEPLRGNPEEALIEPREFRKPINGARRHHEVQARAQKRIERLRQ
jgi:hypothetical protein